MAFDQMVPASIIRDHLRGLLDPSPRVTVGPDSRPGAVLVPILASGEPRLVFTRRSDTLSRHAGEISFPGGLVDPGEGLAAAALREAEEELGLRPEDVELIGALEPVHTRVTGVLIVPFVGLLWRDPRFTPNEAEIAEVLGERAYGSLLDVPDQVDVVDVFRKPEATPDIARQAVRIGAKVLWLQTDIVNDDARRIAEEGGLDVVMGVCIRSTHRRVAG